MFLFLSLPRKSIGLTPSDQDNHPAVEVVDMIEDEVVNKVTKMKLVLFSIHIMVQHFDLLTRLMCLLNVEHLLDIFLP